MNQQCFYISKLIHIPNFNACIKRTAMELMRGKTKDETLLFNEIEIVRTAKQKLQLNLLKRNLDDLQKNK